MNYPLVHGPNQRFNELIAKALRRIITYIRCILGRHRLLLVTSQPEKQRRNAKSLLLLLLLLLLPTYHTDQDAV